MNEYERDLEIDEFDLDKCWREQPLLYMKWSERWARKVQERDRKEQELKIVKAELSQQIRKDWDELGFNKSPSEAAIKTWIEAHDRYVKVNHEFIDLCFEVNVFENAKWAFDHRKKALESKTHLVTSGMHAEPRVKQVRRQEHVDQLNEPSKRKKLITRRR